MQYEKVRKLINDARKDGLRFALGGEDSEKPGYFIPVTIVDNPPEDSPIVTEEAFGPVIPLIKYHDYDEVIERANDSPFWFRRISLGKRFRFCQIHCTAVRNGNGLDK